LINSLMRRDLARCSKHPGRTQQPYYYGLVPQGQMAKGTTKATASSATTEISPSIAHGFLVDLPGYGFAKAPDSAVEEWQQQTQDFLCDRRDAGTLQRLFLLIDARRGINVENSNQVALDLGVMRWMDEEGIPYSVVVTKADCVGAPQRVKVANEACIRYQQQHQEEQEQIMYEGVASEDVVAAGYMGPVVHITSAKKNEGLEELRSAVEAELYSSHG
jgi:GTP-binding protein EngB required for normal cell division